MDIPCWTDSDNPPQIRRTSFPSSFSPRRSPSWNTGAITHIHTHSLSYPQQKGIWKFGTMLSPSSGYSAGLRQELFWHSVLIAVKDLRLALKVWLRVQDHLTDRNRRTALTCLVTYIIMPSVLCDLNLVAGKQNGFTCFDLIKKKKNQQVFLK